LTKPFQPGQDRLAGLEVADSPASGCPVLVDAAAHLDCEIVSRMVRAVGGARWLETRPLLDLAWVDPLGAVLRWCLGF